MYNTGYLKIEKYEKKKSAFRNHLLSGSFALTGTEVVPTSIGKL